MEENSPLLKTIDDMLEQSIKAQKKFFPDSNHHHLLKKQIYALNIARILILNEMSERKAIYKEELDLAQDPLKSLLIKSEKSVLKLNAGTWQHTLLEKNIEALRIVVSLLERERNRFKH